MIDTKAIKARNQRWLDAPHTSRGQMRDSTTIIELCDEIDRLREKLKVQFDKNTELKNQIRGS